MYSIFKDNNILKHTSVDDQNQLHRLLQLVQTFFNIIKGIMHHTRHNTKYKANVLKADVSTYYTFESSKYHLRFVMIFNKH